MLKRSTAPELLRQLRAAAEGGSPLTSGVARTVLNLVRQNLPSAPSKPGPSRLDLTEREQEVLRCLVDGLAYKEAAERLDVSIDSVRTHVRGIYRKLQVHSVGAAVSRALRDGLV
jgi:DNA-binding NarL/FixJ family response regulator